jgi:peptidoglycan/LPS O-acetylase OafA/YrhL
LSQPPDRYRPDIDGLRAVAVTLVVFFHAFPEAVPGGFIGVDVFFVISGFLITGIVVRELGQKRFSLLGFYTRRIRRIFPALIAVLLAVLLLGWLWMLPSAYAQLSADVFASAAFFANIALMLQSGYFDIESGKKPLLHLWSLGIEEQFYLFWPLVLILARRFRLGFFAVAAVVGAASFALNVALIGFDPVATFYLPFTRAWELLAGGALACGFSRLSQTDAAGNWRAAAGFLLIAASAALLDSKSAFPGWRATFPVLGSVLLLSAPTAWGCRHILSGKAFVEIGLISYPLYLWHWPLLVFFGIIKFAPLTLIDRGLVVALSFALAWLTYRAIEIPFRFGRPALPRVVALCSGMAAVAGAGGVIVEGRGFDFRLPAEIREMTDIRTDSSNWRVHECLLDLSHETSFADSCVDKGRRPLIFVWGDSTAGALLPGLRMAQQTNDFGIAQFTSSSCVPALHTDVAGVPNCRAINDKVLSIARDLQPEIVLLHSTWDRYLDGVADTVTALKHETKARVIVLGSVPWWKRGLPNEVLRYFMLHHRLIPQRSDRAAADSSGARLREKLVPLGAEFISVWDTMCSADGCLTRTGDTAGDITASDQVHLTEKGSAFLVQSIIGTVLHGQNQQSLNGLLAQ